MPDALSSDVILNATRGDAAAVGMIYRRYHLSIFRYLVYRVNNQQEAEDLTSEVFVRMLGSLSRYRLQGAPFQAWLFRIARNLAIDHSRAAKVQNHVPLQESLADNNPGPEIAVDRKLTSERLNRALAKLNQDQRDVIILRFVVNMVIADTALVVDKSQDAVKGLQRRGLASLRKLLSDVEVDYV